jgi:transposase
MNSALDKWKEVRRLQAWHLKQKGWAQRQTAEAVGVSEGAISQSMQRARHGGPEALRHRPYLRDQPGDSADGRGGDPGL